MGQGMSRPATNRAADDEDDDDENEEEESKPKLGLGDFIFYSVLCAKAAQQEDMGTVIACYVSIIVGLTATLAILAIYQRALPALPLSIFLALIFFFSYREVVQPVFEVTNFAQVIF